MSVRDHRKPAAFRLDDPDVVVTPGGSHETHGERATSARPTVTIIPEADPALPARMERPLASRRRRFPWGGVFWSTLGGLAVMAAGLGITNLIEDFFARSAGLGYVGLALAIVLAIAFLAITVREVAGLARLRAVEKLHARAETAVVSDDRDLARAVVRDLLDIESTEPRLARARTNLATHAGEIIDGADLIRLAERELMAVLDEEARQLVAAAAKRVSVVTTVSPRALVDVAFVFYTVLALVRRLANLYGARPGTLGQLRLLRLVLAHLALTGGIAATDTLVQQVLGHGVAAKLSAKLGEGVLNGLLTARVGLAAIEVVRPLPFVALPKPSLSDLTAGLVRRQTRKDHEADTPPGT